MNKSFTTSLISHRGKPWVLICFERDVEWNKRMKTVGGSRWSSTYKGWLVPDTIDNRKKCKISGDAKVADTAAINELPKKTAQHPATSTINKKLSNENFASLEKFTQQLILKGYSPNTIRTYRNELMQLLQLLKNKPASELTADDLKRYMVYAMEKVGISENTAHSRLNALKFFYEKVLHKEKFFWEIPRPKKPLILPKLLNEEELRKLFNALTNKKHKAMLFTAYSAGLRVTETVNLKLADIDSKRMTIFIERGKGKKDRYVNLSPVLLDILRSYIKEYRPKPKVFLFESEQTLDAYPARTAQQIFQNAKKNAGIQKQVGIHSLRHSFATHLLDKGTGIKYIKELLGHFNIRTTERYLHVSRSKLVNIVSPFDDLWKSENIDW